MEEIILKPGNTYIYSNGKKKVKGSYIVKYVTIMITADDPEDLAITVKQRKAIEKEIVHKMNSKIKRSDFNEWIIKSKRDYW